VSENVKSLPCCADFNISLTVSIPFLLSDMTRNVHQILHHDHIHINDFIHTQNTSSRTVQATTFQDKICYKPNLVMLECRIIESSYRLPNWPQLGAKS